MVWNKIKKINWGKELAEVGLGLLWPFTRLQRAFPFVDSTFRRIATYFTAWMVAFPFTGALFPTGQNVAQREGVDAAIVERLAPDMRVHVRGDDVFGTLHAVIERGPLIAPFHFTTYFGASSTTLAYAARAPFSSDCLVYIKSEAIRQSAQESERVDHINKRFVEEYANGYSYRSLISAQEERLLVIFHEVAHCGRENQAVQKGALREAHASARAIQELSALPEMAPDFGKRMVYKFIRNPWGENYMSGLYIDAVLRGVTPPTLEAMQDTENYMGRWLNIETSRRLRAINPCNEGDDACNTITDASGSISSGPTPRNDLDRRFLELVRESMQYQYYKTGKPQSAAVQPSLSPPT